MRRQVTLLVAATTSVVLLAFLLPAASLVARVAESSAVDRGEQQVQALVPLVALAEDREEVATVVAQAVGRGVAVAVRWSDGAVLGDPAVLDDPAAAGAAAGDGGQPATAGTVPVRTGRVVLQPVARAGEGTAVIAVLVGTGELRAGVLRTWLVLAGLGLVLFCAGLLLADRVARSMTRPVDRLAATADRLSAGDLAARVEPGGPPEVQAVGVAVNRLAGRIGELLTAEREAAADLAHRLRTPLTALRLDAEGLSDPVEQARLLTDVDQLGRAVDAVISEARRPVREGLGAACDAAAVLADRARFWAVLAEEEGRPMTVSVPEGPLPVRATAGDLAAALDALLANVFAHTPEGTALEVTATARRDGGAELTVADDGPGLPGEGWLARGVSGAGSTGLGLDIARRIAEAAGGGLQVSGPPGTVVVLTLGPPAD